MKVLVIGGTVFVGRAVVGEALADGATVTVFNRGRSGAVPDGVEHVTGDRTDATDLQQLAGRRFDLVVDTCGYVPADVARSAELLAGTCGHYSFVSSINAYPGWPVERGYEERGAWDGDPDATADDIPDGMDGGDLYGWRKVGCERAAQRAFGEQRCTVLRAGSIVGPDDGAVGRLPWWIDRVSRGGEVLVPGGPEDGVALVDARDLARFALSGTPGVFDTGGPSGRDTRADLMAACREATGSDARFSYVDDEWLAAQDVESWTEIPLWVPRAEGPGVFAHDGTAAARAGMSWRPLRETVADTWVWQRSLPDGWHPAPRTPGLDAAKEARLLAAWHAR